LLYARIAWPRVRNGSLLKAPVILGTRREFL
jgi:hypothetical protein